jgi:hypothetical protein
MIKIEKNVRFPAKYQGVPVQVKEVLDSMEIGDSFVVPNQAKVSLYRQYMKRMGKKLESRREHSGERQIEGKFHYRCWYTGDFSSAERLRQVRKKEQQQLMNKKVVNIKENKGDLDRHGNSCYGCDQNVLHIAEIKEENRMIVEDVKRLNKILTEEFHRSKNAK